MTKTKKYTESIDIYVNANERGKFRQRMIIFNEEIKQTGVYLINGFRFWIMRKVNGK